MVPSGVLPAACELVAFAVHGRSGALERVAQEMPSPPRRCTRILLFSRERRLRAGIFSIQAVLSISGVRCAEVVCG